MAGRGVTVRVIDLGPLKRFVIADDLRAAADMMLDLQRKRIESGIGSRGRPMKKLSKAYAADEKGGSRVRTLHRTGKMLGSRAVLEATAERAKIGFRNKPKHAYVNQARTPFVKATKEERKVLQEFILGRIRARLAKNLDTAKAGIR